jgi:hypothetical protein
MSGKIARFSPSKIRARAEEKLGWSPGSSKDISFGMLRDLLKDRFPKLAHEIACMVDAGDHVLEEEPEGVAEERARRFDTWERKDAAEEARRLRIALADPLIPIADREVFERSLAKAERRAKRP